MSKNNDDHLLDDEAFIAGLYQDLPDEQPSELLDQRILKAAHQAVETEKTSTGTKTSAWPRWLKPTASAAALVLVVFISMHQVFDPAAPLSVAPSDYLVQEEAEMPEADAAVVSSEPVLDEVMLSAPAPAMKQKAASREKKAYEKKAYEKVALMKKRERSQRADTAPLMADDMAAVPLAEPEAGMLDQLAQADTAGARKAPVLEAVLMMDLKQFERLKQQQARWQWRGQEAEVYEITVLQASGDGVTYRLDKSVFVIEPQYQVLNKTHTINHIRLVADE